MEGAPPRGPLRSGKRSPAGYPVGLLPLGLGCLTLLSLPTPPSTACDFSFPEFGGDGPSGPESAGPHFLWTLKDSLAACPAGDSLTIGGHAGHPHPARLRMEVWYNNSNCTANPDYRLEVGRLQRTGKWVLVR